MLFYFPIFREIELAENSAEFDGVPQPDIGGQNWPPDWTQKPKQPPGFLINQVIWEFFYSGLIIIAAWLSR
jgi:hypothetical protein